MGGASSLEGMRRSSGTRHEGGERLFSIDTIRGGASLGIFVMNVQLFASVYAAYLNPSVTAEILDRRFDFWVLSHVLADQKFMTLFAVLFGADTLLFVDRAGRHGPVASLYYRRLFWLFVFGMAHAYLLWSFDILVAYSLCGAWVFWLRDMSARRLCAIGGLLIATSSMILEALPLLLPFMPAGFSHHLLTAWHPDAPALQAETRAYLGGWREQMPVRAAHAFEMQTTYFATWSFWRVSGLMCWGMALYKMGFFHGRTDWARPAPALLCIVAGIAIIGIGIHFNDMHAWAFAYSQFTGVQYNYWGGLLVSAGYLLALMRLARGRIHGPAPNILLAALAAVGRAPLSNYFLQTLLGTALFYGEGLGLFGAVDRGMQWFVVAAVWTCQLVFSLLWMRHFRLGPVEWAWRSLSQGKALPIRRHMVPAGRATGGRSIVEVNGMAGRPAT